MSWSTTLSLVGLTAGPRADVERDPKVRRRRVEWSALRHWLWAVVSITLCVGVMQLASRAYTRFDLSPSRRYTLAPETLEVLSKLNEPLIIEALLPLSAPPPYRAVAHHTRDLLDDLAGAHSSVRLRVIDTARERSTEEREEILEEARRAHVPISRLTAEREGRQVFLETPYGVSLAYLNQREVTPPVERSDEVEYHIASALGRLIERRPPVRIGVAQGFGEPDIINSPLARHLGGEGELVPVRLDGDPLEDEVGVLLILGATQSYGERARQIINRFRCDGGGVVIALDHRVQSELFTQVWASRPTGLEPLLRSYGVEVENRWVISDIAHPSPAPLRRDARGHVVATPHPLYPRGRAADHPISAPLDQVPIPMAPRFTLPKSAIPLISSHPQAKALEGLKGLDVSQASREAAAPPEGFPLAFALEEVVSDCAGGAPQRAGVAPSRLVMIGSGRRLLSADARGLELLLNALAWARGEERLLALKRRRPAPPKLNLSADQQQTLKWLTPIIPSLLIGGLTLWLRRPRRRSRFTSSRDPHA